MENFLFLRLKIASFAKRLLVAAISSVFVALSATADAQVVTNNNDSGGGSLRSVIANAFGGDTITFDPSLSGQIIRLTSGELQIGKDLTIDGSALTNPVIISGDADNSGDPTPSDYRVFTINSGATNVILKSLVIADGHGNASGGGIYHIAGNLTVDSCAITGNTSGAAAGYNGGGIFHNAPLTIVNSTISNNQASDYSVTSSGPSFAGSGGGIYSDNTMLTVRNSTITGNYAGEATNMGAGDAYAGSGGGIAQVGGTLSVESSTIVTTMLEMQTLPRDLRIPATVGVYPFPEPRLRPR